MCIEHSLAVFTTTSHDNLKLLPVFIVYSGNQNTTCTVTICAYLGVTLTY